MKTTILSCVLLLSTVYANAQFFNSDFEDGTLQNWTNTDGTTTTMTVEDGDDGVSKHLQKVCDGSNTATGEMAIKNLVNFNGNYNCYDPSGINCLGSVDFYLKKDNSFDLNLRIGLVGANGTKLVSDLATETLNYPEGSDWYFYEFYFDSNTFTVVEGSGSIEETLEDVVEFRLIQNENVSFDGVQTTGTFIVDYIFFVFLLSTEDNPLTNVALFPNPTVETLHVKMPSPEATNIEIYDLSGKILKTETSTTQMASLDVSNLSNGMYFVKISTEKGSILKKFIKR